MCLLGKKKRLTDSVIASYIFTVFVSLIELRAIHLPSSALLISRYILRLGQRGRCCFCAACPNRKMYNEIRRAD